MRRAPWLLLAVGLVTGCGSTAAVNGTAQLPGGALGSTGNELGGSAAPGTTTGGVVPGGTTGVGTTGGTGGVTTPGSTGTSGTTGVVLPPPGPSGNGPGVTATKVYIGIVHDKNAGALNKATGVGSISSGDPDANTKAVIKDINTHGGIAGRQLVPVYASFDQTGTEPYDQQFSAICQQFTHDTPVFAVVDAGLPNANSYRDCLARAHVSIVSASLPISNASTFRSHPGYLELGYPNLDRLAAYEVPALVAQGYFSPWNSLSGQPAAAGKAKVGVLTVDDPDFSQTVDHVLVPALKRLGYDPLIERIPALSNASGTGGQAAAVKSAQLAFASNGVTHVIPFESNGNLGTFFLPTARAQSYYPRYGINTGSAFEALLESGVVAQRQMNGAVGFGWSPTVDLRTSDAQSARYANERTRHCLKVMKDAGITFTSGNAEGIALNTCAEFFLVKTAIERTPKQITQPAFVQSAEGLGTAYEPAGNLGLTFRPGRQDPADKAYFWKYFSGCGCFNYYGPLRTVP